MLLPEEQSSDFQLSVNSYNLMKVLVKKVFSRSFLVLEEWSKESIECCEICNRSFSSILVV